MDSFLEKLYEHNYFLKELLWWYFYSPDLQIPNYAREKGLPGNIDPNKPFGKPKKDGNDIYTETDKHIRNEIMPQLETCLERAR